MLPTRLLAFSAVSLVLSCCARTEEEPVRVDAALTSATTALAVPAPDAAPHLASSAVAAPAISPSARAAYARHLASGRSLAEASRWGEATSELERALAIVPHDARALTDLGWTAFQSGDPVKSARASAEATRVAREPELRSRSLYNLGRAREATGKRREAEDLYRASLALRSNDTVAARLVDLDAGVRPAAATTPQLPCDRPSSLEDLCSCLVNEATDVAASEEELGARACEIVSEPKMPERRARLVKLVTSSMESSYYLAASGLTGWRVVADLAHVYQPGAFGIEEGFEIDEVTEETIGGARTLRVIGRHHRHDSDMGIDEEESSSETTMTVCVLADEKRRMSSCPLTAPLRADHRRARIGLLPDDQIDEAMRAIMTPGLPVSSSSRFEVSLDKDGTATVVLVAGKASPTDRALLGPHKIF